MRRGKSRRFDRPITALRCLPDGGIAVALDGAEMRMFASAEGTDAGSDDYRSARCTRSTRWRSGADGTLLATDGSASESYQEWARDLLNRGRSGRLLSLDPATDGESARASASGLHYAFGACAAGDDDALVSESWRHRLVTVAADGSQARRAGPAAGLSLAAVARPLAGGFWLTAFTARTQLIEFILRESGYRKRMMREVPPEFWVVPRLRSGGSFREPMQGAHLKTMGVVKPWAPPRSYGLVIRLNADGVPLYSLHSRVDGENHGVVAAAELDGALYVLAKGPRRLLRLSIREAKEALAA